MTTPTETELNAIKAECLDGLLQQLHVNGFSGYDLYVWALARELENQAREEGISVDEVFAIDTDCVVDCAVEDAKAQQSDVMEALILMGHTITTEE